jgi:PKD repeat protein
MIGGHGLTGQAVHVHALASTLHAGTILGAKYEWSFGDPDGRYNTLVGFNAAHVYDRPGVYTITLKLTDAGGRVDVETARVTVARDDRHTIYVDASTGSDRDSGATPDLAVRSAQRAFALAGDGTRVLFRRGQRHTVAAALSLADDNVLVGAYGTGALPVLYRLTGNGTTTIRVESNASDVTVQDVAFDSPEAAPANGPAPKVHASGVRVAGTNVTVRDVDFRNINTGVLVADSARGTLVMDNTASLPIGTRDYLVWGEGADQVYLGNSTPNSTREHNIRTVGVRRLLVARNDLANPGRPGVDDGDIQKGCVDVHRGIYSYVVDNVVRAGVIRVGPRGGDGESPSMKTEWAVVEGNRLAEASIQAYTGSHHVMIRNNLVHRYTSPSHGGSIALLGTDGLRRSSDIHVLNNTVIEERTYGQFLKVQPGVSGVTVRNNLFVADRMRIGTNGAAAISAAYTDLRSFTEITGNVWPVAPWSAPWATGGMNYVAPEWGDPDGYRTASEWNAMPQVGTDTFRAMSRLEVKQVRVGDQLAGSTLPA